MEPMTLDVLFAFFSYGGNGGINMLLPEINSWFHKLALQLKEDPRVGRFAHARFGDVPLTMERNRAVATAKAGGFDVLVMLDSDNVPDLYDGSEGAKPFFWSSFDFLYDRKAQGLPSVVVAPYCGPPPKPTTGGCENVYVFFAESRESDALESGFSFEAYSRQQAATMTGIKPIAAGPTGCCMYSVDAFDLMPVRQMTPGEIMQLYKQDAITMERALRLLNMQSWFFYEYTDTQQTRKASTEDVTNTREIQLAGWTKHKQDVVFCNWDAWAGHYKPKLVGKPAPMRIGEINAAYQECVESHIEASKPKEQLMEVDFTPTAQLDVGGNGDGDIDLDPHLNRVEVSERLIGGRRVQSVGYFTPDEHLHALSGIVRMVAKSRPEKPLRIVEVGSWVGESAIAMSNALGEAGGKVFCIDTWEGSPTDWTSALASTLTPDVVFDYFRRNVGDLFGTTILAQKGDSAAIANAMEPQGADIVFLDASHDYKSVRKDLRAWFPHVADNGILCGHDFCDGFPGVAKAVKEMCDHAGIAPTLIEGTTIWCFSKSEYLQGLAEQEDDGENVPVPAAREERTASEG